MSTRLGTAQVAAYLGPQTIEVRDVEFPELGDDDMLLEVILCGVDGTELQWYRGETPWINERVPVIFGDEILGRVVSMGANVGEARGLQVGDRVVVESRWPCEQNCRACSRGQYYLCDVRGRVNGYGSVSMETGFPGKLWGGYATHVFVPRQALVYRAPEELSDRATIIACSPFANGLRWFEATETKVGEHVLVIGPGPQGLCTSLAAVTGGARVTVAGLKSVDDARLAYATSIGAHGTFAFDPSLDTDVQVRELIAEHGPVDAVIEVTGTVSGIDLAIQAARPLGTVVTVASTPREYVIDWRTVHLKELRIVGQISHPHVVPRALEAAVRLQSSIDLDMGEWVTHAFGLHEVGQAIRVASNQTEERPIKVVLDPHLNGSRLLESHRSE